MILFMKKATLIFLFNFCIALAALAASHVPYQGSRIFWDTSTLKTVFASGGYARIAQLQDGRLMACVENNGIDISFSSNKGNTWSAPVKIVSNGNIPECVPDLLQTADGTIIVAYNPRPNEPYSADRRFGIHLKRSTDNGRTWSDDIPVFDADFNYWNGCWEPSLLQLPNGELQLYFADESEFPYSDEQQISVCRSYDDGVNWTAPARVSFQEGNGARDGMPSAVILNNGNIAVAIENSGWPGVGDFIPTIVTSTLQQNWNPWVGYPSNRRWKAFDPSYVSSNVKGGAPYIRRLPWGETVLSHQSTSLNSYGKFDMLVYVGDENAQNFKAMSKPFSSSAQNSYLWNSLCVIDTGVVVAVGNIDGGQVVMQKGYAVRTLQAPFASPTIDGRQTSADGYYKGNARQLILGRERGTNFTADFAYDEDSLYFTSRVSDIDQVTNRGSNSDGVTLLIDTRNASSDYRIAEGIYRLLFLANGQMRVARGNGSSSWQWSGLSQDTLGTHYVKAGTTRYYIVEAAIPWSALGLTQAEIPNGTHMRVNVMLQNNNKDNSSMPVGYEMLPDSKRDESWSWMDFYLQPHDATGVRTVKPGKGGAVAVHNNGRDITIEGGDVNTTEVYTAAGLLVGKYNGRRFTLPASIRGIVLIRIKLSDNSTVTQKILL